MNITLKIDNVYEDGEEVATTVTADVSEPDDLADEDGMEDWAAEELLPFTGTGREDGDAGYFVEVTACDLPALVGRKFEWGI